MAYRFYTIVMPTPLSYSVETQFVAENLITIHTRDR